MLKINNLTITTLKGRKLLSDFSFVLNKGDKIAIIGEEGNGKSTLIKIIAGIDVTDYVTFSGVISTDEKTGYLPQTIEEAHKDDVILDFITSCREPDYVKLYQLIRIINLDMETLHERKISSLSGGEKVRAALARVLYDEPDILLLDEPTNDLDLPTLIWLEQFIINADQAIMFISHDEALLRNCANGILHLEQLKKKQQPLITFSRESYDSYYSRRHHNIDRNNQLARKEKVQFQKQLDRYRQIYQKVEHQQATISRGDPHGAQLLKKKMHSLKAQGARMEKQAAELRELFEPEEAISIFFDHLAVNPNRVVLDLNLPVLEIGNKVLSGNISLFVKGSDKICIIGSNGTGKTTLLKEIKTVLENNPSLHVGYMPQNYREILDYSLSPADYLFLICNDSSKAHSLLGALRFTSEEMTHPIASLSEGQKCKTLLAGLILSGADVLILDEPTRNLSPLSNPEIRKMLIDYGGAIIAVSHDRMFINEVSDHVYELTAEGITQVE